MRVEIPLSCDMCQKSFEVGDTLTYDFNNYRWIHQPCANAAMYGMPDPTPAPDAFTVMQDEVAKITDWPRSKQLQAARFLYNLGIRYDDCAEQLIRRQYKKEQT